MEAHAMHVYGYHLILNEKLSQILLFVQRITGLSKFEYLGSSLISPLSLWWCQNLTVIGPKI